MTLRLNFFRRGINRNSYIFNVVSMNESLQTTTMPYIYDEKYLGDYNDSVPLYKPLVAIVRRAVGARS